MVTHRFPGNAAIVAGVFCLSAPFLPQAAQAQDANPGQITTPGYVPLPTLVVTANRTPLPIERLGASVTVIPAEEIQNYGTKSLADVLRGTPGLNFTESGGPGSLSNVSLRGSTPGQTLVLIDGIRVGDASSTDGALDFGALSAVDIDRIEIVRGPQSALYGSDAMGGVINVLTRKGERAMRRSVQVEAGSYGTISATGAVSGATDKVSYAFSLTGFHSDGFSRYGYRIGRITSTLTQPLENDKTDKFAGSARVTFTPSDSFSVDVGLTRFADFARFDNPGAFMPADKDTRFNKGRQFVTTAFVRANFDPFGGVLKNSLTIYSSLIERFNRLEQSCFDTFFNSYNCDTTFRSRRLGVEYQGTANLGTYGQFIFGAKSERETASTRENWLQAPYTVSMPFWGTQVTNSVFAQHSITLLDRLDLTLGGRIDAIDNKTVFPTWRATAAYRIEETGTRLRVSAGTGAHAASLYQRFSIYGLPSLRPEQNFSYEAGIDQTLLDGRVKASVTLFDSWYRNLIDFNPAANFFIGQYYNVGHARIRGVEASIDAVIVPDTWRARATFTGMTAVDEDKQIGLLRRPRQQGSLSLIYTGIPNLEVEGRIYAASTRTDVSNDFPYGRVTLPQYGRADLRASYKFNDYITAYARLENITNARYQEIRDYGVTGRAIYAGLKVTW
ncbi:MAG: hypothetical protein BGP04_20420 [Rhizobiales bacterium 62-17]|nr:MAG: hypothetical protein BGP04_20420 [Rhizobiales bacterium 62-17]